MDLRLLEVFCLVYKTRSFSRAAAELGLTQPTVSVHIKELETTLGTPLFNRLGHIEPTAAGTYLYEQARPLFALKRNIAGKMAAFLDRVEGQLTVGASSLPGEHLLPSLMIAFHTEHPSVRVRLRITDSASTLDSLRQGDIELGVIGAVADYDDVVTEPFATDELVLITPAGGAWGRRDEIPLHELRKLPLIIREAGSGTRGSLGRALAAHRAQISELNVVAELGTTGAIKDAVKKGCGVSFVSRLAFSDEIDEGTLRIARVPELGTIQRRYDMVYSARRTLSPTAQAFLGYLRERATAAPALNPRTVPARGKRQRRRTS
jgi:DNA-binding transcriptional LysR family regulator